MFANARTYNDPESQVVRDAQIIEAELNQLYDLNFGRAPSRKRVIQDDDDDDDDDNDVSRDASMQPQTMQTDQQQSGSETQMPQIASSDQYGMPSSNTTNSSGIKLTFGAGKGGYSQ